MAEKMFHSRHPLSINSTSHFYLDLTAVPVPAWSDPRHPFSFNNGIVPVLFVDGGTVGCNLTMVPLLRAVQR